MPDEIEAGSDTSTLPITWPLIARVPRRQGALCPDRSQSGKIGVGLAKRSRPSNPLWNGFRWFLFCGRKAVSPRVASRFGTPRHSAGSLRKAAKGFRFLYLSGPDESGGGDSALRNARPAPPDKHQGYRKHHTSTHPATFLPASFRVTRHKKFKQINGISESVETISFAIEDHWHSFASMVNDCLTDRLHAGRTPSHFTGVQRAGTRSDRTRTTPDHRPRGAVLHAFTQG